MWSNVRILLKVFAFGNIIVLWCVEYYGEYDMEYYTTAELAKKWSITQRRVAIYCKEGRFEGAVFKDRTWLIPGDVEKPDDPRKTRKEKK